MTGDFSPEDLAEVRRQGDIGSLFAALLGKPAPKPEQPVEDEKPDYHIARPGAWPCGTDPTGLTPGPYCPDCVPSDSREVIA